MLADAESILSPSPLLADQRQMNKERQQQRIWNGLSGNSGEIQVQDSVYLFPVSNECSVPLLLGKDLLWNISIGPVPYRNKSS